MGEAKRRKATNEYPAGPVENFRVAGGKLAITVEVGTGPPSTVIFDADRIGDLTSALRLVNDGEDAPAYRRLVAGIGQEFLRARQNGEDLTTAGVGVLWSAFYHPDIGLKMRMAVSRALRDTGKAHITWRLSDKGLGMALADRFADLDHLLAIAPRNQTTAFVRRPEDDRKPH